MGSLSNSAGYIFTGDTYVYNGENYSAGDVVARDTYGNLIHVVAGQAGYYKPIDIIPVEGTKGAYTLVFEYNKGSPTDEKHSLSFTTTEVDSGVVYDLDVQLSPGQSQSILLKSTTIDSTIVWVKPI